MRPNQPWWQKTTIYQIYPRSFKDSNRDGIGDLRGIISKLDYIKDIGIEPIWISPFFSSPQGDWGYDVSNYYDIAPEYGHLSDAEELICEVHQRGMRILFDMVMNHTSIQHPWFQESRSSREDPKRDWYIWKDGRGKRPPNNWKAIPGGSGWHFDEITSQWYYASFLPFQPDLNLRNAAVKEAMFDVVRFWLDKGVDGFRLDIFHAIYKDELFRDNPFSFSFVPDEDKAGYFQYWKYSLNQPESFELARDLRSVTDTYSPDRMLLGELAGDDATVKQYLGDQLDGLHLVFLWDLLKTKPTACFFKDVIRHYESQYPAPYTPVYVFGNHDRKRIISKIGDDPRVAKLLALFQFTVRGVPVTYYGEEIGMQDVSIPASEAQDPIGQQYKWIPNFLVEMLDLYLNRDNCRTPMQWDDSDNAGFSSKGVIPWLPVHRNHKSINVKTELHAEGSLLNVYGRLLHLRRNNRALQAGTLELIEKPGVDDRLLMFERKSGEDSVLLVINFGDSSADFQNHTANKIILFEVGLSHPVSQKVITMPPLSGIVLGTG
jgi:oligo-1,6-glucosidase/alpha-glucosidase